MAVIVLLVLNGCLAAQRFDTLNFRQIQGLKDNIQEIHEYPADKLLKDTKAAFLLIRENEGGNNASLLFKLRDSVFIKTSTTLVNGEGYMCKSPYVWYSSDTLICECNLMRGIMAGQKFRTKGTNLFFLSHFQYDVNEQVYKEAEKANKNKDPLAYCQAYMASQYYPDYVYRVMETLSKAHEKALKLYQDKEYKKAAQLMLSIELHCSLSTDESVAALSEPEFKTIWGDASLFYLKAGMHEDCIRLAEWMHARYPNYAPVLLQYGDALFNMNDKDACKKIYAKYEELMTKNKEASKIPARVKERMN